MCRLGSCHINMSTGQNLHRTTDGTENELISPKIKEEKDDVDVATDVALIKEEPTKIKEEKDDDVATDVATASDDAVMNGATTNGATDDALIKEEPMEDEQQQQQQPTEPKVPLVKVGHQSDIKNVISRDTTIKLRKNTYPFVCKRHFEVANKNKNNNNNKQQKQGDNDNNNDDTTTNNSNNNNDTIPAVTSPSNNNNNSNNNNKPALELKERKLIDFRNKVYIAPLTTVGNLPFRRIMKQYGADITCGEMALCDQLLQGKPSEWALLKRHPSEDVFGVQIASGHADQFTRVAEILANEDGFDVDFVDMNLGCPIDLVCDKGAGACLMQRDKKLRGSLEGMMKVLPCPVTIKMRTGWDEKKPMAHSLVTNIQKWGIDGVGAIMIHGRSRLQRYSRLADWDYIAKVASIQSSDYPQIPVIGNGDIFSYTDYEEKILKHIDEGNDSNLLPTAMLGRGALIKPWLPTEIKERRHWDISASERLDMLKDFVKYGLEHYGSDQQGVNTTRRFLLEWISFLHRYVPVGMLEVLPQQMNHRPPQNMCGRSDLETLMLSKNCADWIKICEMLLGPVPDDFAFEPKHKANSY